MSEKIGTTCKRKLAPLRLNAPRPNESNVNAEPVPHAVASTVQPRASEGTGNNSILQHSLAENSCKIKLAPLSPNPSEPSPGSEIGSDANLDRPLPTEIQEQLETLLTQARNKAERTNSSPDAAPDGALNSQENIEPFAAPAPAARTGGNSEARARERVHTLKEGPGERCEHSTLDDTDKTSNATVSPSSLNKPLPPEIQEQIEKLLTTARGIAENTDAEGVGTLDASNNLTDAATIENDTNAREDAPATHPDNPCAREIPAATQHGATTTQPPDNNGTLESKSDDNDDIEIWHEYIKLALLPTPPARIPPRHVKEFIAAAERSAATFLRLKTTRALFDILRLPKTVFDPYITRRKTAIIRSALNDYPRVELPDPHAKDRKRRKRSAKPMTEDEIKKQRLQRAETLFREGYLRKAMKAVTSKTRPVPLTAQVVQRLRDLHPEQDTSDMTETQYAEPPDKPDEEDVYKTIKKINIEASGGLSGWNPRHLKVAMRSPTFAKFITEYAGMMAEGTAPGRHIMTIADGIALKDTTKPSDKLRPIDMGEVFYKVCAITCLRKNRQHGDLLPFQLGSGTPGGVEPLIWLERQHLMGYGGWESNGKVDIDRTNAFNTMKLAAVQRQLHKTNPKNGPLFEWAYSQPAHIIVKTADGNHEILTTSCLRQGDPTAGYFYQMGDRRDMEKLNEALGDKGMAWSYIDDLKIFKSPTNTEDDNEPTVLIAAETLTPGSINTSKTVTTSNEYARTEGCETLGGFIGPPEKRAAFVKTAIDKLAQRMRALEPLRKQTQLILLRQCVIPSLNHLMRNVNPDGCQQHYQTLKRMIATKISQLADSPVRLGNRDLRAGYMPRRDGGRVRDTDLISLPTRYGGLGMGDQVAQSTIAWEACQHQCKYLMDKWMKGTISGPPPDKQKKRMEDYWRRASNQLMDKMYRQQCMKVACNAEKSASSWLTTIPHLPELLLPDASVAAGLRSRLLKSKDRIDITKRKVLHQRLLNEFKSADYESKLVTTSTTHTTTDDPTWISDSLVEPMAISVMGFNLSLVTTTDLPVPPPKTPNVLSYYRKKLHTKAAYLQRKRFQQHYRGYVHFPFTITSSGALMGKSEGWIRQLKQRARLNQKPSAITQIISSTSLQSMC